ncbi:MAG TPA: glucans biosynthesis glucosyltransferase MdoH [Geminicoccus sp.]|uniref:glucans biosynthesis glucosyltransferase MdoH n=1 Tax=Geminicoccus sp. TaxID=2024832 RepID=UPI002C2FFC2B|nr:glucans biosynthesis glucosyltransferase MdoH [Geminicoccus sp.]HWL68573.1 glucans biosynthesis glucosyltransferase MdoH [Geminicoccus sp.]
MDRVVDRDNLALALDPAPADMPVKGFTEPLPRPVALPSHPHSTGWRLLVIGIWLTLTGTATWWLGGGLAADGLSAGEIVLLTLFTLCFGWLAFGFALTVAGFLALKRSVPPAGMNRPTSTASLLPPRGRTAVLMPLRNEDPTESLAKLESLIRDLAALKMDGHFAFHILSDSNVEEVIEKERRVWQRLVRSWPQFRIMWRVRTDNYGKKAGNIAEFCRSHGGRYDYMLILDADSLMSGRTLASLARLMDANPDAGIIQVSPGLTEGETRFTRYRALATRIYGPIASAGLSIFAGSEANYYGHHAIIRVRAFTENCGLPELPGKAPLGGPIMSHDFVEAALVRRSGWRVWLAYELDGAVEDSPPTLIDEIKRDRRWMQGNLQHLRLLRMHGLHPLSRLHFFMGAWAYMVSAVWMALVVTSLIVSPGGGEAGAVLPSILMITLVLLFAQKLLGITHALAEGKERSSWRFWRDVIGEQIFSTLTSPLFMVFHTRFLLQTLRGQVDAWGAQARGARRLSWGEVWSTHMLPVGVGVVLLGLAWWFSPTALPWLAPVLAGLWLGPVATWWSAGAARSPVRAPFPAVA